MAENPHSQRRGPGSTPGQVTVSHKTKLRVHTPRWKIKDPVCRNKDPHSQINVLIFKSPKLKPNQKSTLNRKRDSTAVVRFGKPSMQSYTNTCVTLSSFYSKLEMDESY